MTKAKNKYNNKPLKVLSLFDGISCGRLALENAGFTVESYVAFEIDKYAKAISRYNYPDILQCGDVLEADFAQFKGFDMVIGGSPCTFWSIAKTNREVDKSGIGWKLFMCFSNAVKIIRPKWFLYENVASMPNSIKAFISEEFACEPVFINSALLSAQQRKRLYWTNIKGVTQPKDKGILLADIIESGLPLNQEKSWCMTARYGGAVFPHDFIRHQKSMIAEPIFNDCSETDSLFSCQSLGAALRTREDKTGRYKRIEVRKDGKLNTLTTVLTDSVVCEPVKLGELGKGGQGYRVYSVYGKTICLSANGGGLGAKTGLYKIDLPDGDYYIRKLTPIEAERCQTLPYGYTTLGIDDSGKEVNISNTQRYKCIGNGWTADVISHILEHIRR